MIPIPWPLYTVTEALGKQESTQFVTVRSSPNSVGRFQNLRNIRLGAASIMNHNMVLKYKGRYLSWPRRFCGHLKILYEGFDLRSHLDCFTEKETKQKLQTIGDELKDDELFRFEVNRTSPWEPFTKNC